MSPSPTAAPAIELIGIDKKFGAVHANKNINLTVAKGSIHGIIGENGAGKSTLMSILYGFYHADGGSIRINGKDTVIHDSQAAISAGSVDFSIMRRRQLAKTNGEESHQSSAFGWTSTNFSKMLLRAMNSALSTTRTDLNARRKYSGELASEAGNLLRWFVFCM